MNAIPARETAVRLPHRRFRTRWILLGILGCLAAAVLVVAACLLYSVRVGRDVQALRRSLLEATGRQVERAVAFRLSPPVMLSAHWASELFPVEREVRTVLRAVRRAEVSVQRLDGALARKESERAFEAAEGALQARGWRGAARVLSQGNVVGVYVPGTAHDGDPAELEFLLFVAAERNLVVVSATCRVDALLRWVEDHGALGGSAPAPEVPLGIAGARIAPGSGAHSPGRHGRSVGVEVLGRGPWQGLRFPGLQFQPPRVHDRNP